MAFDPTMFADFETQEEFDSVAESYEAKRDASGRELTDGEKLNIFFQTLAEHGIKQKETPDSLSGAFGKGLARSFTSIPRLGGAMIEAVGAANDLPNVQAFGQGAREAWESVDQEAFSLSPQALAEAEAKKSTDAWLPTAEQFAMGVGTGVGEVGQMLATGGSAAMLKAGSKTALKQVLKQGAEIAAEKGATGAAAETLAKLEARNLMVQGAKRTGRAAGFTFAGWKGGASTTDDLRELATKDGEPFSQDKAREALTAFAPSFFINGLGDMAIERVLPSWKSLLPGVRGKVLRTLQDRVVPVVLTEGTTEAIQSALDAGVKAAFVGQEAIPDGLRGVVRDSLFEGLVGGFVGGGVGGANALSASYGWKTDERQVPGKTTVEKPKTPVPPDGSGSPQPVGPTDLAPSPIQTKEQRVALMRIPEVSSVVDSPDGARLVQLPGGHIEISTDQHGNQLLSFLGGNVKGAVRYGAQDLPSGVHGQTRYFDRSALKPEVSGVPVDFLVDIVSPDLDTLNHEYYHVFERYVLSLSQQRILDRVFPGGPETRARAYASWGVKQGKGHPLFKKLQNTARNLWMAVTGQKDRAAAEKIFQSVRAQQAPTVKESGGLHENVLGYAEEQITPDDDYTPEEPGIVPSVQYKRDSEPWPKKRGRIFERKNPYAPKYPTEDDRKAQAVKEYRQRMYDPILVQRDYNDVRDWLGNMLLNRKPARTKDDAMPVWRKVEFIRELREHDLDKEVIDDFADEEVESKFEPEWMTAIHNLHHLRKIKKSLSSRSSHAIAKGAHPDIPPERGLPLDEIPAAATPYSPEGGMVYHLKSGTEQGFPVDKMFQGLSDVRYTLPHESLASQLEEENRQPEESDRVEEPEISRQRHEHRPDRLSSLFSGNEDFTNDQDVLVEDRNYNGVVSRERLSFLTYPSEQDEAYAMHKRFRAEARVLTGFIERQYGLIRKIQKLYASPGANVFATLHDPNAKPIWSGWLEAAGLQANPIDEIHRALKHVGRSAVPNTFTPRLRRMVEEEYVDLTMRDYLGLTREASGRFSKMGREGRRHFFAIVLDERRDVRQLEIEQERLKNKVEIQKVVAGEMKRQAEAEYVTRIKKEAARRALETLESRRLAFPDEILVRRADGSRKMIPLSELNETDEIQYKRDEDAIVEIRRSQNIFNVIDADYVSGGETAWSRIKAVFAKILVRAPRAIFDRYYSFADLDRRLGFDRVHPDSVRTEFQLLPDRVAAHFRDFMEGAPRDFNGNALSGLRNYMDIYNSILEWGKNREGGPQQAMKDFITTLQHLNILDRVRNGMKTGLRKPEYYQATVDGIRRQAPFLIQAADDLQKLNNAAFHYLVEAGAISESLYQDTLKRHPYFSPFIRPEDLMADNMRTSMELSPVLLRQEKFAHMVQNPLAAIAGNMKYKIEAAFQWRAMQRAVTEYADLETADGIPEIQRLMQDDPDYLKQVANFDLDRDQVVSEFQKSGMLGNIAKGLREDLPSLNRWPVDRFPAEDNRLYFEKMLRFNVALNRRLIDPEKKIIVLPRFEGHDIHYDVYRVANREVFNALVNFESQNSSVIKLIRAVTPVLQPFADTAKSLITVLPEFFGANIFRDFFSNILFLPMPKGSRLKDAWAVHKKPMFLRGLLTYFKRKDVVRAFQESGADFSSFIQASHEYSAKMMERRIRMDTDGVLAASFHHPYEAIAQVFSWLVHPLNKFSSLSENISRLGAFSHFYDTAKEAGKSDHAAIQDALAYTKQSPQNFARGGYYIQELNKICPFLSAGIGGWLRIMEAIHENPRLMRDYAVLLASGSIGLMLLNREDDRWKEIPDYEKDMYWFVLLDGLPALRIPKPFEAGTFFGSVPERMVELALDDAPFKAQKLRKTLFSFNLPNPTPTAFVPILQNMMNKDWKGAPVIPKNLEFLSPEEQYSPYTSETAKMIAAGIRAVSPEFVEEYLERARLTSPKGVENVLRGYLGGGARYLTEGPQVPFTNVRVGLDPLARVAQGKPAFLNEAERTLSDVPGVRRFVSRTPNLSAQPIQDFYTVYGRVQSAHSTFLSLGKLGNTKGARDFSRKHKAELMAYKRLQDTAQTLNQLHHSLKVLRSNETMLPAAKRAQMDRITEKIIRLSEGAIKNYQRIVRENPV